MDDIIIKCIPIVVDAIKETRVEHGLEKSSVRISRETLSEVFKTEQGRELLMGSSQNFVNKILERNPKMSEETIRLCFIGIFIEAFLIAQDEVLTELTK